MRRVLKRSKKVKTQRGGSCSCQAGAGNDGIGSVLTMNGGTKRRRRKKGTQRRKRRIMKGGSLTMNDVAGMPPFGGGLMHANIEAANGVGGCTNNQCFS